MTDGCGWRGRACGVEVRKANDKGNRAVFYRSGVVLGENCLVPKAMLKASCHKYTKNAERFSSIHR